MIFCDICGNAFDSNCKKCKNCKYYKEGFKKFGRTKSNEEYQIEMLIEMIKMEAKKC